jgi:hypothetical protein
MQLLAPHIKENLFKNKNKTFTTYDVSNLIFIRPVQPKVLKYMYTSRYLVDFSSGRR